MYLPYTLLVFLSVCTIYKLPIINTFLKFSLTIISKTLHWFYKSFPSTLIQMYYVNKKHQTFTRNDHWNPNSIPSSLLLYLENPPGEGRCFPILLIVLTRWLGRQHRNCLVLRNFTAFLSPKLRLAAVHTESFKYIEQNRPLPRNNPNNSFALYCRRRVDINLLKNPFD